MYPQVWRDPACREAAILIYSPEPRVAFQTIVAMEVIIQRLWPITISLRRKTGICVFYDHSVLHMTLDGTPRR